MGHETGAGLEEGFAEAGFGNGADVGVDVDAGVGAGLADSGKRSGWCWKTFLLERSCRAGRRVVA